MRFSFFPIFMSLFLIHAFESFSQVELPKKFQNISNIEVDEEFLEAIIDSIENSKSTPLISLEYIRLYEELCMNSPDLRNDLDLAIGYKSNSYSNLAWKNNQTNIDLAMKYLDSAEMIMPDTTNDYYWKIQYGKGAALRNKGDNKEALTYLLRYNRYYSNPTDSSKLADVLFQISACQYYLGELEGATASIVEAMGFNEKLGRYSKVANGLNLLAIIKKKAGLREEVLSTYERALEMKIKAGSSDESQGNTLYNMANYLVESDDFSSSLRYYYDAKKLSEKSKNLRGYVMEGLGTTYLGLNQLDSAKHYLEASYDIRKTSGSDIEIGTSLFKLGLLASKNEEYDVAIRFFEKALPVAEELEQTERIKELTLAYSLALEKTGRYRESLKLLHNHIEAKEQYNNQEIAREVEDVSVKYETEKKENEIALLNAQSETQEAKLKASNRRLRSLGIGSFLLLVFLGIVGWLYREIKNKNNIIATALDDKDTLLKEIHHRVKNNLQVISALLTLQSKHVKDEHAVMALQEGQGRVHSMSLIHQDLYQHDNLKGVNTKEYFEKLIDNLIQTYDVEDRTIDVESEVDSMVLDVDTMIPLGLVVNELASNALKHAFKDQKSGLIKVQLKEKDGQLILNIKDNGVGADLDELQKKSFGYSLIKSFARRLDADLDIQNNDGLVIDMRMKNYQKIA